MDYDDIEFSPCDKCGGDGDLQGHLGTRAHYCCQDCGWRWSEAVEQVLIDE